MSALSVKEQLEGILSDFEALKRSFDVEDEEGGPSSFPTASAVYGPGSPSTPSCFLSRERASEGQKLAQPFVFSNNSNTSRDSRSVATSTPGLTPRPHAFIGGLSFNRGHSGRPWIHNHGGVSVIRAASFQGRSNPNSYSTAPEQGSDDDSLSSSSSSLDLAAGWGPTSPTRPALHSPLSQLTQTQSAKFSQRLNRDTDTEPRKSSSAGTGFHSKVSAGSRPPTGSVPPRDLQGPGGGTVDVPCGGAHRCTSADSSVDGAGFFGQETCSSSRSYRQQESVIIQRPPQARTKETPTRRLNKFPLDLDSLVSGSPSIAPSAEAQREPHKPPPHSKLSWSYSERQHQISPPSTSVSPSASLSSLDSSSGTPPPPLALHYPFLPFAASSSSSSTSLQLVILPETYQPPSVKRPAQSSPEQEIPTETQSGPKVSGPPQHRPSRGPCQSTEGRTSHAQNSPGSATQSVAFSSESVSDQAPPTVDALVPAPQIKAPTDWKEGMKKQSEMAEELDAGAFEPMEGRGDEQNQAPGAESEGPAVALQTQSSREVLQPQEETTAEEQQQQLESGVKMALHQCEPDLQKNQIGGPDLFGYVGIEAVLDQIKNKTVKAGFEFNLMVVGQSGLGKSTLVNTLFKSKVSRRSCAQASCEESVLKTVKLRTISHVIEERGVRMKLTVVDTPGFGDRINNQDCWEPIVKYVNQQYERYLREELHVRRQRPIPDTRVHCCIYFLPATGHRLRPIDSEFMKRLGAIVSIVPVIAKSDTLTIAEREGFKERIRQDIAANGISVYPQQGNEDDPEERLLNERIRRSIPFAVVGTDQEHQVNGNKVLGRKTNWGIVEVENVAHCEFANLRDLLIRSHLQDLKDVTHNVHYENYRTRRLNESNVDFSAELAPPTWALHNGHGATEQS